MALTLAKNNQVPRRQTWKFVLAWPLFGTWLVGCNNTCFTFTSNPPTGTINVKVGDLEPSCKFTTAKGVVRVLTHTVSPCRFCSESSRIAHMYVSFRGIEAHANASADDTSPDWQELVPQLPGQPVQVDLTSTSSDPEAALSLGEGVAIPADAYRQLRLRLVPNQPGFDEPVPQRNECGRAGFNCVVSGDGQIHLLLLDRDGSELRITPEKIPGGFLLVPPDNNSDLVIELDAVWSLSSFGGEGVDVRPLLVGKASIERRPAEALDLGRALSGEDIQGISVP
jgi:hypothetical protein